MDKNELFEQAIKKLNTDEGILEEDYVKLLEPLFARQKEKIKEKVDYTENNEGKLTFFLYEDDAKELQEWGLNCAIWGNGWIDDENIVREQWKNQSDVIFNDLKNAKSNGYFKHLNIDCAHSGIKYSRSVTIIFTVIFCIVLSCC